MLGREAGQGATRLASPVSYAGLVALRLTGYAALAAASRALAHRASPRAAAVAAGIAAVLRGPLIGTTIRF